jgi:hypothetical protein
VLKTTALASLEYHRAAPESRYMKRSSSAPLQSFQALTHALAMTGIHEMRANENLFDKLVAAHRYQNNKA